MDCRALVWLVLYGKSGVDKLPRFYFCRLYGGFLELALKPKSHSNLYLH
jgi:hypothetical protein